MPLYRSYLMMKLLLLYYLNSLKGTVFLLCASSLPPSFPRRQGLYLNNFLFVLPPNIGYFTKKVLNKLNLIFGLLV